MPNRLIIFLLLTIIRVGLGFSSFAIDWKSSSVLSSGRWVKVKVTENGIQEISYATLRELGFNNPEKIAIFGYGGAALYHNTFIPSDHDDLPQIPAIHNHNRLLFYGVATTLAKPDDALNVDLQRNHYATAGYYFLTDSHQPATPEELDYNAEAICDTIHTHQSVLYLNPMEQNPVNAGVFFFSKNIVDYPEEGVITIHTPQREPDTDIHLNGIIATNSQDPFTIKIDGTPVETPHLFGNKYIGTALPDYILPYSAENSEQVCVEFTPSEQSSFLAYDYLGVSYTRRNCMDTPDELQMFIPETKSSSRLTISGNDPTKMEVWDITDPTKAKRYKLGTLRQSGAPAGTILYLDRDPHTKHLISFLPDATHHTPSVEPLNDNQNLHSLPTPDMLIITTDECYNQAERLAGLHRQYQGFEVNVVRHEDIFNEFSSGTPSVMAYRRMAKMFYDHDNSKFRYLLLFGASIYDNRLLLPHHSMYTPDKMLLCYQPDDVRNQLIDYASPTSDAFFGMLHNSASADFMTTTEREGYNEVLVSVGRIPAISDYQARVYVDKVEKYLTDGKSPEARTRALVFSDDGESDVHLKNAEKVVTQLKQSLPATIVTRAHNSIYHWKNKDGEDARRKIIETLEQGVGLFYYAGHGRPDCLTSENLWSRLHASTVHNSDYPLTMFSACNTFSFDRQDNNIGEASLFAEDGGTIALIAASREVYGDENRELAKMILKFWGEADENDTYGDIFRRAQNNNFYMLPYLTGRGATLGYNFGGDPALPLFPALRSIQLTEANGKEVDDNPIMLQPLRTNNITGYITDKAGTPLTDYNGEVTLYIYESERSVPNLYSDNPPAANRKIKEIQIEDDLLCSVKLPIVNGRINGTVLVPAPARPDEKARIVLTAESNEAHHRYASSIINGVIFGEIPPEPSGEDNELPEIVALYLDSPAFRDGSITGANPVVHAEIKGATASSLINLRGIWRPLKLILDNVRAFNTLPNYVSTDADGSIFIDMPLNEISEGTHTLTLSITDIFGNTVSDNLNFQVVNSTTEIKLTSNKTITDSEVTFDVEHTFPDRLSADLIIEDLSGKHIQTIHDVAFPYTWEAGSNVTDGSYLVRVMATDGKRFCGSSPRTINVIR